MKMDLLLPIIFTITPVDGLCYRVVDSSILQEIFLFVPKCSSCNAANTLSFKIRQQQQKNEYKYTNDMLCVMTLTQNQ